MLRKALLIFSGNAAASLLLLVRNLLIARIIPVSDYGVAATFAIVMAAVEMGTTLGLQQQIVQSRDGEQHRFQAALQGFQVLRGVLAGLFLFFVSSPLAAFFGVPEVVWAYQVLALVPVLRALEHFDIYRLQRQMKFGPMLLSRGMPALVTLCLIWPLAVWFRDWQIMLWSILTQFTLSLLISHILAERRYVLAWDKAIYANSLHFGWPLLINAFLLFVVLQGDKLVVGRVLGLEALAIFAMGVTITLTPTLVLAKSAQNLFLPRLSRSVGSGLIHDVKFARTIYQTLIVYLLGGNFLVLLVVLFGISFVDLALGPNFAPLGILLVPLAIGQALRVFRGAPSTIALAFGKTANAMIANLIRCAFLPLIIWMALSKNEILPIILVSIAAELCAFLISLVLFMRLISIPKRPIWISVMISIFLQFGVLAIYLHDPSQLMNMILFITLGCGLLIRINYSVLRPIPKK